MASITDKISRVSNGAGRPNSAVVQAQRTVGGTSLSCDDLTNWTTDDVSYLAVYTLDTAGKTVPGSQVDFKGIVTGNTINNLTVTGGTDRAINVGDVVVALPTAQYAKDLGDAILATHNQNGTLKNNSVTTAAIANNAVTTAAIANNAVTAPKIDFTTLIFSASIGGAKSFTTSFTTDLSLDISSLRAGGIIKVSFSSWGYATTAEEGIEMRLATNLGTICSHYGNRGDNNKSLTFSWEFPKTAGMTTVTILSRTQVASQSFSRYCSISAI